MQSGRKMKADMKMSADKVDKSPPCFYSTALSTYKYVKKKKKNQKESPKKVTSGGKQEEEEEEEEEKSPHFYFFSSLFSLDLIFPRLKGGGMSRAAQRCIYKEETH